MPIEFLIPSLLIIVSISSLSSVINLPDIKLFIVLFAVEGLISVKKPSLPLLMPVTGIWCWCESLADLSIVPSPPIEIIRSH